MAQALLAERPGIDQLDQDFSLAHVDRLWFALCDRMQDPVRVHTDARGTRTVEVLGVLRYLFLPTARKALFAWRTGRRWLPGRTGTFVQLDPPLLGDRWIAIFAHATRHDRAGDCVYAEDDEYYHCLVMTPAVAQLARRVDACNLREPLIAKVREALALDPAVLQAWREGGGARESLTNRTYSLAWQHVDRLAEVRRSHPGLARLYWAAAIEGHLGRHPEPLRDLKLALKRQRLGEAAWRIALALDDGAYAIARAGADNVSHFDVYAWLVAAHAVAGGRLPDAVITRFLQPHGAEPGSCRRVEACDTRADWMPAFLRGLGRRVAGITEEREMTAFLDDEFEPVLDWLERTNPEPDANQARAGWPWMLKAQERWRMNMERSARLASDAPPWDVPIAHYNARDYQAFAIRSPLELLAEGERMRHCVYDYVLACATGGVVAISIRQGGVPVATGMIAWRQGQWHAMQARRRLNRPVEPAIEAFVERYARACNDLAGGWIEGEDCDL